jgi:hypothetical protein
MKILNVVGYFRAQFNCGGPRLTIEKLGLDSSSEGFNYCIVIAITDSPAAKFESVGTHVARERPVESTLRAVIGVDEGLWSCCP